MGGGVIRVVEGRGRREGGVIKGGRREWGGERGNEGGRRECGGDMGNEGGRREWGEEGRVGI